jgi:hypothetical protein
MAGSAAKRETDERSKLTRAKEHRPAQNGRAENELTV